LGQLSELLDTISKKDIQIESLKAEISGLKHKVVDLKDNLKDTVKEMKEYPSTEKTEKSEEIRLLARLMAELLCTNLFAARNAVLVHRWFDTQLKLQ
jgi:predicted  nucleic acid-binding Zn-ribbon protein